MGSAAARPTGGRHFAGSCSRSVSAYWRARACSSAPLRAALFLFSYRGYKGVPPPTGLSVGAWRGRWSWRWFPAPSWGAPPRTWWGDTTAVVHYVAAVVLFLSFIAFALWRPRLARRGATSGSARQSAIRDDVCLGCGGGRRLSVRELGGGRQVPGDTPIPSGPSRSRLSRSRSPGWLKGEGQLVRGAKKLMGGGASPPHPSVNFASTLAGQPARRLGRRPRSRTRG